MPERSLFMVPAAITSLLRVNNNTWDVEGSCTQQAHAERHVFAAYRRHLMAVEFEAYR